MDYIVIGLLIFNVLLSLVAVWQRHQTIRKL